MYCVYSLVIVWMHVQVKIISLKLKSSWGLQLCIPGTNHMEGAAHLKRRKMRMMMVVWGGHAHDFVTACELHAPSCRIPCTVPPHLHNIAPLPLHSRIHHIVFSSFLHLHLLELYNAIDTTEYLNVLLLWSIIWLYSSLAFTCNRSEVFLECF